MGEKETEPDSVVSFPADAFEGNHCGGQIKGDICQVHGVSEHMVLFSYSLEPVCVCCRCLHETLKDLAVGYAQKTLADDWADGIDQALELRTPTKMEEVE